MVLELDELRPLVGTAWLIGEHSSSSAIIQRLSALRAGTADDDAPFVPGDFLIGDLDVGRGDQDVRATMAALRNLRVAALIARSFDPRFYDASIERGVPALVIEEAAAIRAGDRLRVDIEQHKIANQSSGDRYIVRNLYDAGLDILRAGGLAAYRVYQARAAGGTHQ